MATVWSGMIRMAGGGILRNRGNGDNPAPGTPPWGVVRRVFRIMYHHGSEGQSSLQEQSRLAVLPKAGQSSLQSSLWEMSRLAAPRFMAG
jgi:hypothetical protein